MKSAESVIGDLAGTMIALRKEKTKHLFGWVNVGGRGQIVIPREAREIFGRGQGISSWWLVRGNAGSRS